jgi:hypothetical protein
MKYNEQVSMEETNPEYAAFVEKFKPKKTTDDCYTPENVFNAVAEWACAEYGIKAEQIVRPFWPGGDYEAFDYPDGCVVLDNPPFSILANITAFYNNHEIRFFLFAPSLVLNQLRDFRNCMVISDTDITYENGAVVRTAFVTNLEPEYVVRSAPDLRERVKAENDRNTKAEAQLPKYAYPDHVLTAAMVQKYAHYGVPFGVRREDAVLVGSLDAQKAAGKKVFGAGLLLSEKAAAEKAAAEKAGAVIWELSEREKRIIGQLGGRDG